MKIKADKTFMNLIEKSAKYAGRDKSKIAAEHFLLAALDYATGCGDDDPVYTEKSLIKEIFDKYYLKESGDSEELKELLKSGLVLTESYETARQRVFAEIIRALAISALSGKTKRITASGVLEFITFFTREYGDALNADNAEIMDSVLEKLKEIDDDGKEDDDGSVHDSEEDCESEENNEPDLDCSEENGIDEDADDKETSDDDIREMLDEIEKEIFDNINRFFEELESKRKIYSDGEGCSLIKIDQFEAAAQAIMSELSQWEDSYFEEPVSSLRWCRLLAKAASGAAESAADGILNDDGTIDYSVLTVENPESSEDALNTYQNYKDIKDNFCRMITGDEAAD